MFVFRRSSLSSSGSSGSSGVVLSSDGMAEEEEGEERVPRPVAECLAIFQSDVSLSLLPHIAFHAGTHFAPLNSLQDYSIISLLCVCVCSRRGRPLSLIQR